MVWLGWSRASTQHIARKQATKRKLNALPLPTTGNDVAVAIDASNE